MVIDLAHTRYNGPPGSEVVVLLGSLGSTRKMWGQQMSGLSSVATVLAVDIRGHGGTPAPPGPYRIADLGRDVLGLLDALGYEKVHLVGLSLGGAIAQWLAINHPRRVHTLSLLCTAAKFGHSSAWVERAAVVRRDGIASLATSVVGRWFTAEFASTHPQVAQECSAMVKATDDEGYAACCEALSEWDSRVDLSTVQAPTLLIAGTQDPATTPADLAVIAERVPRATLHVLNPGAHLVSIEQADRVTALIRDHISTEEITR
ncbi:3-oxoadipate enol-lactonase [Nocardia asiatica]|uniref:3-oxoadipate enol-lactonase n=1 Tax=Nocardia asiatica TaxID=209252 RepID=UPI0002F209B1|nr:3-oxoadipate enol-lactonase [Nocardia asiatica]